MSAPAPLPVEAVDESLQERMRAVKHKLEQKWAPHAQMASTSANVANINYTYNPTSSTTSYSAGAFQ